MMKNENEYGRVFNLIKFMNTTPEYPVLFFFSSVWLSAELSHSEFRQAYGTDRKEEKMIEIRENLGNYKTKEIVYCVILKKKVQKWGNAGIRDH